MLFALSLLLLVADAPKAPAYQPKYKPVRLHNGVEFRPSPDGFAFVKDGKVLKRYTFNELGGVPEDPECTLAGILTVSENLVAVDYCIHNPGFEGVDTTVMCYMTNEGELKWCAKGFYVTYHTDTLGRFLVGGPDPTWGSGLVTVFTPRTKVPIVGPAEYRVVFSPKDSLVVIDFLSDDEHIISLFFVGNSVLIGDTALPLNSVHVLSIDSAKVDGEIARIMISAKFFSGQGQGGKRKSEWLNIPLRKWSGDTLWIHRQPWR